jgi:guanylate kinase
MNKPLFLLVGKSGSGKTTAANKMESMYSMSQLQSYTTRPRRTKNEVGHTFITDAEFDCLNNIVAYTEYNGYRYCCTKDQVDATDIYVVDIPGVETLLDKYKTERTIVILYFDTTVRTRIDRMVNRGDSDAAIISRLYNDEENDWKLDLLRLVRSYRNTTGKRIKFCLIDANQDAENVMEQVKGHVGFDAKERS